MFKRLALFVTFLFLAGCVRVPVPSADKAKSASTGNASSKSGSRANVDDQSPAPPRLSGREAPKDATGARSPKPAGRALAASKGNVEAAKAYLRDNTNDPARLEIVRMREGAYKAIPNGPWSFEDYGGITAVDRVEWLDTRKWNGADYVWIKYREANEFGGLVLRDKTFIFTPKGIRVTDFPAEEIWRSEKVTKVITPEESDAIQAASDKTLGDLFGLRQKYQEEQKQQKK